MDLVLDASTTIAWALNESDRLAARTWERMKGDQALVPTLWWFELRNALVVNERRGRITEQQTARFLRNVERLAITIDGTPDESGVLTLARRHRLTRKAHRPALTCRRPPRWGPSGKRESRQPRAAAARRCLAGEWIGSTSR